jgi:hypothetical protein
MLLVFAMVVVVIASIAGLVLGRPYEVHGTIARTIFVAVLAPILRVPRRDVQVDRFVHHARRRPLDDDRCGIDVISPEIVTPTLTSPAVASGAPTANAMATKAPR